MPYAELLEFNQPNFIRKQGFTRIRDAFPDLVRGIKMDATQSEVVNYFLDPERIVEFAGRWDYGEKNAQRLGNGEIIERWMASGEESMIEMAHATFFVECSRVVSHEFVRHRLFSFQQESQRFTKYDEKSPDDEGLTFNPGDETEITSIVMGYGPYSTKEFFSDAYFAGIQAYKDLRAAGVSPQNARYVLPNAMLTRMIVSGNMREWRHFLRLRTHRSVQPEMRELALMIYEQLNDVFPTLMKGILDGERAVR